MDVQADSAANARDSVDRMLDEWAEQGTGLDFSPVGVVTRLARVRTHLDAELLPVFAAHDLTAADFAALVTLRRAGPPYRMTQSALTTRLGLTSGTISVRLTRLASRGLVTRDPSPDDGRGSVIALTDAGLELFDRVAPQHLHNEETLLSALTADERGLLVDLLRRLLVSFEHQQSVSPLGLVVVPAHQARRMRVAVGLSDTPGLLVTSTGPGGAAEAAGLRPGDLLVTVDRKPLRSCVTLADHTARAAATGTGLRLGVLRGEQQIDLAISPVRP